MDILHESIPSRKSDNETSGSTSMHIVLVIVGCGGHNRAAGSAVILGCQEDMRTLLKVSTAQETQSCKKSLTRRPCRKPCPKSRLEASRLVVLAEGL